MQINVTGLRVWAHHGVLPHESELGQEFVLDLALEVDDEPRRDNLAETVDYGALAEDVSEVVAREPLHLIETVAQRAADVCVRDTRVHRAVVTVHKPSAPLRVPVAEVSVTVERSRPALHVAGDDEREHAGADVRPLPQRDNGPDGVA